MRSIAECHCSFLKKSSGTVWYSVNMKGKTYTIRVKVWLYPGDTAVWYFVTVPKKESTAIKILYKASTRGWGSLPVAVTLGKTVWETSIFPDGKMGTYLLPLKKEVRKKEGIREGDSVKILFSIRL